jgi:hypothetical protein
MNLFQALLEVLLLSLIIIMGIAIIHILSSNPYAQESVKLPSQSVTMPDDARERGDYLLSLIKEGHFKNEKQNYLGS